MNKVPGSSLPPAVPIPARSTIYTTIPAAGSAIDATTLDALASGATADEDAPLSRGERRGFGNGLYETDSEWPDQAVAMTVLAPRPTAAPREVVGARSGHVPESIRVGRPRIHEPSTHGLGAWAEASRRT
jgi:hypothetical protein